MAKSQAQQKDSGQTRTGEAKSKSDALGQEVESLEQLSALADLSPQVSQLKGISDLAQNGSSARATSAVSESQPVQFAGKAPAAPAGDAGVSVSLQQELVLLEGELSFGAKLLGGIGMDTSFAKLTEAVKRYTSAASPDQKEAAKSEVVSLGNTWLSKHKGSTKKGDDRKDASIRRILQSLQEEGRTVELGVSIDEDGIETDYKAFTAAATGTVQSAEDLYALFQKAHKVKSGIDGWKRQHPRQETPADVQKAKTLTTMEASMASMSLNMWFKPYFAASATGIDMNQLSQGIFSVRNVTVNVTLSQGMATGSMTNVIVGPRGFIFDSFSLSFSGDLQLSDGFKIGAPSLSISSTGDSYSVTAGGDLALSTDGVAMVTAFEAGGKVTGGYDFSTSQFHDPTIEGGYIKATLFDCIDVDVQTLGYAAGHFTAGSGSMTVRALGKSVTGTVGGLTYAKSEGVGLTNAKITSTSDFEPVPGFTVSQPTLELNKTAEGWAVHGSGKLSVQMSGAQYKITKLDANVSMDYSVHDKATGFALESGNMDVQIFNSLRVTISELGYSSATKKLTAASAGMSLELFGKPVDATMNDISHAPGAGFDFSEAVIASPADFEPIQGFKVSNPVLRLLKEPGGWKVGGAGTLVFNLGLGDAIRMNKTQAGINLLYNPNDGNLEDFSLADGSIDLALYDHVHLSGSGIEFDKASGALTIGTMVVTLNNADALGAGSITGGGEQLVVRKGGFDWGSIKLNYNKKFEVGGFSFTPPFAVITKSKDSYQVELNDMQGEVSIGDSLNFAGSANMLWDPDVGGAPEVTGASLEGGYSGDLVSDYLSAFGGRLSFSTGFSIPFAAGPVPMEAYVEFGGNATAPIELKLGLDKSGDAFQLSGEMGLRPELTLYIKAGVGVGTSLLIYGGVYVKGELTSTNVAKIGITGSAKASDDYTFDNVVADYELGTDLKAKISAGGEVKFLYFFKQELYEVRIKEWPLGESKIEGKYDMLRGKPISETGTKLFDQMGNKAKKGTSVGIPLPDADYHSKSYMAAITRLNNAIDSIAKWNDSDLRESKGPEALARHKTKVTATFERFINTNTKKLTGIEKKLKANDTTVKSFLESHRLWLERQQQKKEKAVEKEKSGQRISRSRWGHLQTSEHYTKKIDQGNQKYESKLAPKTAAMEKLTREHDLVSEELRNVRAILTDLDSVLSADGTFNMDALISRASGTRVKVEEAVAEAEAVQDVAAEVFDFEDREMV
jgi:hypothetical protein